LYSDEDKLLADGAYGEPFFKPDWSPDLLLSWNYAGHLLVIKRSLLDKVGGFREGFDGSQDHDLLLRATEQATSVGHVTDILYAWRKVPGSAALSADFKPAAREAGKRAVEDALRRRGAEGTVTIGPHPFVYQTRHAIRGAPTVGIVIPTRDRLDLLRQCIA